MPALQTHSDGGDSRQTPYAWLFIDNTLDAMFLHDEYGRIVEVNQRACDHLGYSREELVGMSPGQFDPKYNETVAERITSRLQTVGIDCVESIHRRKDGVEIPVEVRLRGFVINEVRFYRRLGSRHHGQKARAGKLTTSAIAAGGISNDGPPRVV